VKRRRDRRGRPRKATARRRATTTAARQPDRDEGTSELREKKLVTTGRPNLELNPIGVLYGRELIDIRQYGVLSVLDMHLRRIELGWGGTGSLNAHWAALVAMTTRGSGYAPVAGADRGFGLAAVARRQLAHALAQLNGSRDLVVALIERQVPPLIRHALANRLTRADKLELDRLRTGLDRIADRR
jgi:hypothetical protein